METSITEGPSATRTCPCLRERVNHWLPNAITSEPATRPSVIRPAGPIQLFKNAYVTSHTKPSTIKSAPALSGQSALTHSTKSSNHDGPCSIYFSCVNADFESGGGGGGAAGFCPSDGVRVKSRLCSICSSRCSMQPILRDT